MPGNHPPAPAGLDGRSLSVLAIGLGVLADVTGSAALIWRFAAERRQPGRSPAAETRAAIVVAIAAAQCAPPRNKHREDPGSGGEAAVDGVDAPRNE